MRMQTKYTECITALRNVGEKEAQAQACNEVGDVWLHHGDLREATAAWNDSLDLITGPYQVLAASSRAHQHRIMLPQALCWR